MRLIRSIAVALVVIGLCGQATWVQADWGPSVDLGSGDPRGAIGADGTTEVAYLRPIGRFVTARKGFALRLISTAADGLAGRSEIVADTKSDVIAVAAARGRAVLVSWLDASGLHVATRARGQRHLRLRTLRAGAPMLPSQTHGLAVVADPNGGWVLAATVQSRPGYDAPSRVVAVSLTTTGAPRSALQTVGDGRFTRRGQNAHLAINARGDAELVFVGHPIGQAAGPEQILLATRSASERFGTPTAVADLGPDGDDEPAVSVAPGGPFAVSYLTPTKCGDSPICAGRPRVAFASAGQSPEDPFGPALTHPNRASQATGVLTSNTTGELTYVLKDHSDPFSSYGVIRAQQFDAGGRVSRSQRLSNDQSDLPYIAALSAQRTLLVWSTDYGRRFQAALRRPHHAFTPIRPPRGTPPFDDADPTRDLTTAGSWALQTWVDTDDHARYARRHFLVPFGQR